MSEILCLVKKLYYCCYKVKIRHLCCLGKKSIIGRQVMVAGGNKIGDNAILSGNSSIGYGSYIGPRSRFYDVKIGKYTCIGSDITMITGNHPSSQYVSIHPAFFSLKKQSGFTYVNHQKFDENKFADSQKKYRIIIGNDVWIGSKATIFEGITIGDGAIIAAGALVNHDVPPYSIVGGVPAKMLRKRYTEEYIEFLLEDKWWDKDQDWIRNNADLFENIELYYRRMKNDQA